MSDQKLDPQTDPRPEPRSERRWPRRIRRVGIGLLALLLLLAGVAAFLVGTTAGGRLVLSVAESFLPDDVRVEFETFEGRLIDGFEFRGVSLRVPTLEATADRVTVAWLGRGLLRRRVHVRTLVAEGLDVRLIEPDSARASSDASRIGPDAAAAGAPLADLPVEVSFDSIVIREAGVTAGEAVRITTAQATVTGAEARVPGRLDAFQLVAAAHVELQDLASADAVVHGIGSTTGLAIDSVRVETLNGQATAAGTLTWWPEVTWDVDLAAEALEPAELAFIPDPEEWPGELSLRGASTGTIHESDVRLDAAIDTLFGVIRDEPLAGRFELHLSGPTVELPAARLAWGPATVDASGTVGDAFDLTFDARVPDLGLVLPGSTGRLAATGGASGPRDTPRIRATVRADDLVLDAGSASSITGDVDLDLAGPLHADLVARTLVAGGQELDSARVVLKGRRDAHTLAVAAGGPGLEFELEAAGGLDAGNNWSGSLDALRLAADTVGAWRLSAPAGLTVGTGGDAIDLRFEQMCIESDPATSICAEGETGGASRSLSATVTSLRVERFAAFLPEGYRAEAGVDAVIDLAQEPGGAITGAVDVRTTSGSVTLPIERNPGTEDRSTTLRFEPISLEITSTDQGSRGRVDLFVTDTTGARLFSMAGELDSPFALRQVADVQGIADQPFSAHAELTVDDMELFSAAAMPRWDAWGSFDAVLDLDVDTEGRLTGSLHAATDSLSLRNTVREHAWILVVDPARLDARVGPDGLTGDLDLAVTAADAGRLLEASGEIRLPQLTSLPLDPEEQPVDANLTVRVSDLYFVEAFLPEVTEARGHFELNSRVGGTLAELTVDGQAVLSDGYALIPLLGLELQDIQFSASGRPDGNVEIDGQVRSGDGTLTLSGRSERYPSATTPTRISVRGDRFHVIDTPDIRLVAEPTLDLAFDGSKLSLTGDVRIPSGRVGIPEVPESAITPSDDVVIVGDSVVSRERPVPIEADITLTLGDDVFFNGFGFSANMVGNLNITQAAGQEPRGRGEIRFVNGTFRQLGQELRIDPGRLLFSGPIDDPAVDARAFVRATDGTEAGFRVGGTVQNLDLTTYSNPPHTQSDIMAYILFGRPMSQTTGEQGNQATGTAATLGANMLAMSLAPTVGLDEARVETGTQANKAQFVVGKYLSPRLYVGYGIGIYEPISTFRLRYLLTARWTIEAITGDQQSTDLLWRIERGGPKEEAAPAPAPESAAEPDAGSR